MRSIHTTILLLAVAHSAAFAQSPAPALSGEPSSAAQQQIADVRKAIAQFASPAAARDSGFRPFFGWIPTMGTHWVHAGRMLQGKQLGLTAPSQLMYSRIDGQQQLVGAAFAYLTIDTDSTRPTLFDGAPPWHAHPDLAPPGTNLVMLHVWFVPSPDGPFAGHNPYLPFWALGLTPPDAKRVSDPVESVRIRKAALALAEVADSAGVLPQIARRDAVKSLLQEHRDAIRRLVPLMKAAEESDPAAWNRIAGELGTHWDAIRQIYLKVPTNPAVKARLTRHLDEMQESPAGHHHH